MSKKLSAFIILLLLAINIYTLVCFHRSKAQYAASIRQDNFKSDELHSYKINFGTDIENSNLRLEGIVVKDSLGNVFPLKEVLNNGKEQILVCRFSESHCESCVNFSIRSVCHWADSIGKYNLLFLGSYRNNKIFNRVQPLYNIHSLNVYNISQLNIPAEELGYPYYFVLNRDLTISNIFIPDKATQVITNKYLEKIYKRYFRQGDKILDN